jgi:hypothetical protein
MKLAILFLALATARAASDDPGSAPGNMFSPSPLQSTLFDLSRQGTFGNNGPRPTACTRGQLWLDYPTGALTFCITTGNPGIWSYTMGSGVSADVTGQSTSQSTVTLAVAPAPGAYWIDFNAYQDAVGGTCSVAFTFNWIDVSARSLTTASMSMKASQSTSNFISGPISIYVGSGDVTYSSTVTGSCAGSSYSMRPRLVRK